MAEGTKARTAEKPQGLQLSTIRNRTHTVPVEFEGEKFEVTYRRGILSRQYDAERRAVEKAARATEDDADRATEEALKAVMVYDLSVILESWTVLDGAKPVPITQELLESLDFDFLGAIYSAIWDDRRPPVETSTDSSGT
ncbi:MAG TPA: hypothetical protein VGN26_03890 [Armatimonadota bacterium]|jgi:hypothetical protein